MTNKTRIYYRAMFAYWLVLGLITTFFPTLMDPFQTEAGIGSRTKYSDHVWLHAGLDIIAFSVLLFALSKENVSRNMLRATGFAALMPTATVAWSLIGTGYWSPLFIGVGLGCLAFSIWGFALAAKFQAR